MFSPPRARSLLGPLRPQFEQQWNPVKNRLLRPQAVSDDSHRLVWWTCSSCAHDFRKRVDHHCADKGRCPQCKTAAKKFVASAPSAKDKAQARGALPSSAAIMTPMKKASPLVIPDTEVPVYARDKRILSPMLASNWHDVRHRFEPDQELLMSPKMDGIRCIVAFDSDKRAPYFMTRRGTVLESCDAVATSVAPLFKKDPGLVLDGELYIHGAEFNVLAGAIRAMRRHATKDHVTMQQRLQLHVFDTLYAKGAPPGAPFEERLDNYTSLLKQHSLGRRVVSVKQRRVKASSVDDELAAHEDDGYEGIMLRSPDGPYVFGKRARTELMKAKSMQDAEYVIVGVVPGQGRFAGTLGALQCRTSKGQLFHAAVGCTDKERKEMWRQRASLIGVAATVRYQDLSPTGIPRFPYFKAVRGSTSKADWL